MQHKTIITLLAILSVGISGLSAYFNIKNANK